MFKWVKEYFMKKYIKGLLDKLPADGRKTIVGALLVVLGGALTIYGQDSSVGAVLALVIQLLKDFQHVPAEQLGGVVAVVGLAHKYLKKEPKE